jgi:2-keto-4-pentenoate hydratase/2-oxohepta-3-ene-1,7-dioic acid hydratase in catechol pathway
MRLFSFRDEVGLPTAGVIDGENVVSLARLVETGGLEPELAYLDLGGLLEADPGLEDVRAATARARAAGERGRPIADVRPAAAIPRPGKIVCIGLNYHDHLAEQHVDTPTRPLLFSKFANAVIADGEPIVRPPGTHALDLEAELGVVIGRSARRVGTADAMAYVAGYVVIDDVTARDWQGNRAALAPGEHGDGQWLRAKGSDTFCPMSPVLVTADEIADPHALRIRSWRIPGAGPAAGQVIPMQDGTSADMVFDIPVLIEFVSSVITLDPGDVISTGTPAGVGVFREPPVFLEPGDRVRCEVRGVGRVENPVIDWSDRPDGSSEGAGRA